MPPLLGAPLARALGSVAYLLAPRLRDHARVNIPRAFPGRSASWYRRVVRGTFEHRALTTYELIRGLRRPEKVLARITAEGSPRLDDALARGEGLLLLGGHLGNYWLILLLLRARGERPAMLATLVPPAGVRSLRGAFRHLIYRVVLPSFGATVIDALDRPRQQITAHLRAGGTLLFLADRPEAGRTVAGKLLALDIRFSLGAAELAAETETPLLPVTILRQPGGRHQVRFTEPLPTAGRDPRDVMLDFFGVLGHRMTEAPEQWLWFFPPE